MRKLVYILLFFSIGCFAQVPDYHFGGVVSVDLTGSNLDPTPPSLNEGEVFVYWNNVKQSFRMFNGFVWSNLINVPTPFSGDYNDLTNQPTVPTNNNQLTNGAGYITGYTVTQGDVTAHEAALTITESQISNLIHFSGNYNDLINVPNLANVAYTNLDNGFTASQSFAQSTGIEFGDSYFRSNTADDVTLYIEDDFELLSTSEIWLGDRFNTNHGLRFYINDASDTMGMYTPNGDNSIMLTEQGPNQFVGATFNLISSGTDTMINVNKGNTSPTAEFKVRNFGVDYLRVLPDGTMTLPQATVAEVSNAGSNAVLTRAFADANYVGGSSITNTSDLTNNGSDGTSTYVEADELTPHFSGDYNDLINQPTIPTHFYDIGVDDYGAISYTAIGGPTLGDHWLGMDTEINSIKNDLLTIDAQTFDGLNTTDFIKIDVAAGQTITKGDLTISDSFFANSINDSNGVDSNTGTSISLGNCVTGTIYNKSTPSTANTFTSSSLLVGGYATVYVDTTGDATFPSVTGGTERTGANFEADTIYKMIVYTDDGTNVDYFFLKY